VATPTDNSTRLDARNRIQWAALQVGLAIVAITAFVETIRLNSTTPLGAARLCFAAAVYVWLCLLAARVWYLARQPSEAGKSIWFKTYSVPTRFGIGTLLAVTLVFAIVSALFRLAGAPVQVVLVVFGVIAYVGMVQFAFDKSPRQASVLAGAIPFAAWPVGNWYLFGPGFAVASFSEIAFISAYWAIGGALVGWLVGALIGSVFMCFAGVHAIFAKRASESIAKCESSSPTAPTVAD